VQLDPRVIEAYLGSDDDDSWDEPEEADDAAA
jgi:hypothetical protein